MITTTGSIIRTCKDGHMDVTRGNVDIRFVYNKYHDRGSISLTFGDLMIYADADQFIRMLKKEGVI